MTASGFWSGFSSDPRRPDAAGLRATDADRDHATQMLREAYADGRLTHDEYDERTDHALSARTLGELMTPFSDLLPTQPLVPDRPTTEVELHAKAVRKVDKDIRDARNGFVTVSVITTVIWAATSVFGGDLYFFWPVFPMLGVGLGYGISLVNRDSQIEEAEEKLLRRRRKRDDG